MADKKKKTGNHIVVFQDLSGNVLKTAFVSHGGMADPPQVPEKNGESDHHDFLFAGWDQDVSHVTGNIVTRPVYEKTPKKYLVMYFGETGKVLGTETVPYGSPAGAPFHPEKEGNREFYYVFTGWNQDLTHVDRDLMVKPVFRKERHLYRVDFFHEDGSLISRQEVFYGQAATEPQKPAKEADPVWHYEFDCWDKDFSRITGPLEVHAGFRQIYNDYRVSFYEEGKLCREYSAHYGDEITYPALFRKGYTLVWEPEEKTVTGDISIYGSYYFTNPRGRIVSTDQAEFEILNPSVTEGSVKVLSWHGNRREQNIKLPEWVKIDDYHYRIRKIGQTAFKDCRQVRRLHLPDSVTELEEYAISDCLDLEELVVGKGLEKINRKAFARSPRLRRITIHSDRLRIIRREAFAGLFRETVIRVRKSVFERLGDRIRRSACELEII